MQLRTVLSHLREEFIQPVRPNYPVLIKSIALLFLCCLPAYYLAKSSWSSLVILGIGSVFALAIVGYSLLDSRKHPIIEAQPEKALTRSIIALVGLAYIIMQSLHLGYDRSLALWDRFTMFFVPSLAVCFSIELIRAVGLYRHAQHKKDEPLA